MKEAFVKNEKWLCYVAWLGYCFYGAYLIPYHEQWRDEANTWILARDLDYVSMLNELRYNSTTALWPSLVFVLNKLGLPYISQNYLNLFFGMVTSYLLIFKSPFSFQFRVGILLTYLFSYQYLVIARPYMMTIMLLFTACVMDEKKFERAVLYAIVLFLLANSSVHGLFAALIFGAAYLYQVCQRRLLNTKNIYALSIIFVGGLLALITIFPAHDGTDYQRNLITHYRWSLIPYGLVFALTAWLDWENVPIGLYGLVLLTLTLILALLYRAKKFAFCFTILGLLWVSYIIGFKYQWPSPRHYGFFLVFIIAGLWLAGTRLPKFGYYLQLLLFVCLIYSVSESYNSYKREKVGLPFSGSKDMAIYLKQNKLDGFVIAAYKGDFGVSVLPYLPNLKLWYPESGKMGTYRRIDAKARKSLAVDEIVKSTYLRFSGKQILFLTNFKWSQEGFYRFELLHKSLGLEEEFYLYQVKPITLE